jgi:hypothetical protein
MSQEAEMKKRFQATTMQVNKETLNTIIDRETGQYCAVTYRYEVDAILAADMLNNAATNGKIEAPKRRTTDPQYEDAT